ncbi:aminotransferase class V-fold PLP-dependent enzyme [Microbacterium esteraromaticum]|uniref:Aminotransferase class V-fold PLP-dependent enzyme n=1 Tax=Microbacterium esteraromaticum TaxID=57043 RepID=A0A7D8AJT3_9MICO|nr:aminotransferase class V-fold PLP-dependent enzyme [Microbacterium esteraromaticum]QMU97605.1 aminotransferase class V-fold PLP-dependent enzyme [Microbacterium esteraromaticum]
MSDELPGTGTAERYVASCAGEVGYLNWAALGPLSPTVRASIDAAAEALGSFSPRHHARGQSRSGDAVASLAHLLGARADEVVLSPSSTGALQHALYGVTGTVIAATADFPSITLPLQRAADLSAGRLSPRWIDPPRGWVTADAVADALDDSVTAVAVSHVDYRTGYRADLAALRELIGPERLLIVDAVQSFGVVAEDWSAADVVVGHGYKWLRAGRGTGFARFSDIARGRIAPLLSGITGTAADGPFRGEVPRPADTARAYTTSVPDHLASARLAAALDELQGVGVAEVEERVRRNADRIIDMAARHGIRVETPNEPQRRAGIVSLIPAEAEKAGGVLADAGLVVTVRGGAVRVAAHAGTSAETLDMLDTALAASGR